MPVRTSSGGFLIATQRSSGSEMAAALNESVNAERASRGESGEDATVHEMPKKRAKKAAAAAKKTTAKKTAAKKGLPTKCGRAQ